MDDSVPAFYDDLAEHFHLIFQDWNRSIGWQSSVLGPLIERELPQGRLKILDCACGIGTQALALVARGHEVVGSDISPAAILRAQKEASQRGFSIAFTGADMRDLSVIAESSFDAVIAIDNALPHLLSEQDLKQAAGQIASKLRPGGLFIASIRDYDQILDERPTSHEPAFFQDGGRRRIYHQVWDWMDDRQYTLHLYLTRQTEDGWDSRHFATSYRAVLREELSTIFERQGFTNVRWMLPAEAGFYQPVLLAKLNSKQANLR